MQKTFENNLNTFVHKVKIDDADRRLLIIAGNSFYEFDLLDSTIVQHTIHSMEAILDIIWVDNQVLIAGIKSPILTYLPSERRITGSFGVKDDYTALCQVGGINIAQMEPLAN